MVSPPWQYILGARMRSLKEVRQDVLSRGGRFREVHSPRVKQKDPSPLKVKQVIVEDRRYVVCLNEEQARKDAHDREAILASLREQLKRGPITMRVQPAANHRAWCHAQIAYA